MGIPLLLQICLGKRKVIKAQNGSLTLTKMYLGHGTMWNIFLQTGAKSKLHQNMPINAGRTRGMSEYFAVISLALYLQSLHMIYQNQSSYQYLSGPLPIDIIDKILIRLRYL